MPLYMLLSGSVKGHSGTFLKWGEMQKILEVVVLWQWCIHFFLQFLAYLLYIGHFLNSEYLWLCLQTRDCYWCVPYFFCLSVQPLSLVFIKVPVVKFTFRINISDLFFSMSSWFDILTVKLLASLDNCFLLPSYDWFVRCLNLDSSG